MVAVPAANCTGCRRSPIVTRLLPPQAVIMSQADLQKLEVQLDQLLSQFQRLKGENAQLRAKAAELAAERSRLLEKNELAAHKVEAMLIRLRGLEQRG